MAKLKSILTHQLFDFPEVVGDRYIIEATVTLSQEQIANLRETEIETTCVVDNGGVLVMRPLLVHATSKSTAIQ